MNLIEAVLPMEMDNLCTNKLPQNLKETTTGELMCKQKNFHLLPLGPRIFYVWRFSSCCSTIKSKLFFSYNSLKDHHGIPMFELRGLIWTQRKFTESKLTENILVQPYHFRELNSQAWLFSAGKSEGFYWFLWFFSPRQLEASLGETLYSTWT